MPDLNFISADNKNIRYMGRIDFADKKNPMLIYAGSTVSFDFTGTSLTVLIRNYAVTEKTVIGYFIDNRQYSVILSRDDKYPVTQINVSTDGRTDERHSFTLFKRMDGYHMFQFCGFYIDQNAHILPGAPVSKRRMECYGDSVSCGAVCEAADHLASTDPENNMGLMDNCWYAYNMITARILGASINNISQGGAAVLDSTGYCFAPYYPGMETIYSKLRYIPYFETSQWDFSLYTPDVVLIALGQNDPHCEGHPDNNINDPEFRQRWISSYSGILNDLIAKYPQADFILFTTILMHDEAWDKAIDEIFTQSQNSRVHRFRFRRTASATPGHPRIPEQEEMAAELSEYISSLGSDIWAE
ncbi:MAG: electron transporter RnfD [Oscillospiraceae bacterium]|nr:electron transporter RnfD [Oscillospiraceae bacterium]